MLISSRYALKKKILKVLKEEFDITTQKKFNVIMAEKEKNRVWIDIPIISSIIEILGSRINFSGIFNENGQGGEVIYYSSSIRKSIILYSNEYFNYNLDEIIDIILEYEKEIDKLEHIFEKGVKNG